MFVWLPHSGMTATDATPAPHSLDQPYYGIGPVAAVKRFFQKYATFSGRASRSEYWWTYLALSLAYLVLGIAAGVIGATTSTVDAYGERQPGVAFAIPLVLIFLVALVTIVPGIAVAVRRLHDANFSGFLYFLHAVPYIGSFVLLILAIMPSNPVGARYDLGATTVVIPARPTPPPAV